MKYFKIATYYFHIVGQESFSEKVLISIIINNIFSFEVGDVVEIKKPPECIKWRATHRTGNKGCTASGRREFSHDKDCSEVISEGSGYCECKDGRKTLQRKCTDNFRLTCEEACTKGLTAF